MVMPSFCAKGGISSVVNGYRGSKLEEDYDIKYFETYCDGNKALIILKFINAYVRFLISLLFWKPQLMHIHSSFGGSFYRKRAFINLAYVFKIKIVNHIHGADFDQFYWNAKEHKKKQIKKTYEKCNVIIALSSEWKERLSEIVSKNKITVIENYSVLNINAIKERNKKTNTHNILFLGFICKRKGCYDIPKIAEKVIAKVDNAKFVLAGSGDINGVQAIIPIEIKNHFMFPGWVRGNEKDRLLRDADIFFLPSYNEGMPMSILDAMGYGLPVVSTNVGGISKIVHHGKNGYICEPGNIQNLAEFIITILNNNKIRRTMGIESASIVHEQFSIDKHICKVESVYYFLETES